MKPNKMRKNGFLRVEVGAERGLKERQFTLAKRRVQEDADGDGHRRGRELKAISKLEVMMSLRARPST